MFRRRPFQGADPALATFLFVGLDANYDAGIESTPAFASIIEYHNDGAAFWRRHGVHHPFLLPGYSGDGGFYHRSFAKVGFRPEHAELVSFVELMDVPTAGRSRLLPKDLDAAHLERLRTWVFGGAARYIFVTSGVLRLLRAARAPGWPPRRSVAAGAGLRVVHCASGKTVYQHLHFSTYGKFQRRKDDEAAAIRNLLGADS